MKYNLPTPQQKRKKAIEDGWEYARLANLPYHLTEHSLDFARRRRWHRKMVALNPGKPAVFYFEGDKKKKDKVMHVAIALTQEGQGNACSHCTYTRRTR